jgi:hypothetical protein
MFSNISWSDARSTWDVLYCSMRSFVGFAATLALALALPVSVGCETEPSSPSNVDVDAPRVESKETIAGRNVGLGVLGLSDKPEQNVDLHFVVANFLLDEVEAKAPGTLAKLSTTLGAQDVKLRAAAFVDLKQRLREAAQSPGFDARVNASKKAQTYLSTRSNEGTLNVLAADCKGRVPGVNPNNIPNIGQVGGRYGDDYTGASGAIADSTGLLALTSLGDVRSGAIVPDPASRLGAYKATLGYPPGTVGHAVNNAIATIYVGLGTYGEEKIGRVFNSPEARALYNEPVESDAGILMAGIEQRYWDNVRKEDSWSPGGQLGAAFSPDVRDWLQRRVFGSSGNCVAGDAGSSEASASDCNGKSNGWYCTVNAAETMLYCEGGQIGGGCPCAGCSGSGPASCSAPLPPAACP